MGLILDSSVVIAGERRGGSVSQILERVHAVYGSAETGISVITVMELSHGIQRATDQDRRQRRQAFVDRLLQAVPVYPVTWQIAMRAGRIQGDRAFLGIAIAVEDLLIGSTALELGFGVATSNLRHFQAIPGLLVAPA